MIIRNCLIVFIFMFAFYAFGISLNTSRHHANETTLSKNQVMNYEYQLQRVLNKTKNLSQYQMSTVEVEWGSY